MVRAGFVLLTSHVDMLHAESEWMFVVFRYSTVLVANV